jgi:hypothetical protein
MSTGALLRAVNEIVDICSDLHGWKMDFDAKSDEFNLDSDIGSALFSIIENCLFDISSISSKSGDEDLILELNINRKGSYLEAVIRDNCPSNSIIENVDIAAYYQGLISVRNILKEREGLLWVDRAVDKGERFRFTLPMSGKSTDYRIFTAAGKKLGVLSRCIEKVVEFDEEVVTVENDRYYYDSHGGKVPVYGLDELGPEYVEKGYDYNYLVVFGIAEERIAILCENDGYRIETVPEQAVEESQLSISTISLQIGEDFFPVLDPGMVLRQLDELRGKDLSYAAPVSSSADPGIT